MDPKKSMDDQFSKLHPCFPVSTRIGIIGGGPSGLSAAYALTKLGYNNVTVLEKCHTVSGMCESVDIQGKVYDLGGQVLAANSAPTIFSLAKETGSELVEMDSHKLALISNSTGKFKDIQVADDYVSVISLTLEVQDKAKESGRLGVHAISDFASDLTPDFLKFRGFKSIPKSVEYGYVASGYGFVQDMPYVYIHEFTRTSMAGKIRRFKDGYMSLWQKISRSIPIDLRCNTEVLFVRRSSESIKINFKSASGDVEEMEFDRLIVSGAFPFKNGKTYRSPQSDISESGNEIMDMSEMEKDLFSKVQTIDYYTTVLKITGMDHLPVGFYYFKEFMEDPATIGNPVAMQRFYEDTNIFLFWSYGNSADITGKRVTELAIDSVKNMGGTIEEVVLQRRFKYFPHVSSQEMKDGFYDKIETQLQGNKNTYYIGGLMAFELTERNSSYAMALICKHFANDSPLPIFPYIKKLFPLKSDFLHKEPKKLEEFSLEGLPDLSSLDAYLRYWGTHTETTKKNLYTWINDEGEAVSKRSYEELNINASCIAQKLLSSKKPIIKPGDRVLLVHVPGLDFVDAFFGCLRARVLPVPVLPSDPLQRGGQALLKIENIAKSCKAAAILSTSGYHIAVRAGAVKSLLSIRSKDRKSTGKWPDLPWLHTDSWIKNIKNNFTENTIFPPNPQKDDLCFLQFTSGSTGDAKGVMITHGGLIHNVKLMRKKYKSTPNTVLVSWLPQYHDMGLIGGLFTAMVSGGTAILFSPMTFIKNPLLWLETMSRYRATHSAGPNFAFELVVRRLENNNNNNKDKARDYNLSSMKFLMIAAEPVRQKTVKRFIELTSPFGLSEEVMAPGYGLAENCVFVSVAFGEKKPILVDWQGRICCGYIKSDDEDIDIKIVDSENGEIHTEDGKEGEIWISSPSTGIGYWGREELTDRTFKNKISEFPDKIYTRTGDLGRVIEGNLFITGRIKDLIIVAGRNIYSADVEKTVETSSELIRPGCCAVIGVTEEILLTKGISLPDASDQVGLVVIAEVRDGKPVSKEIIEQIQSRIIEEHGVPVATVKLIKPRTISKTTSGKIKRFDCLKQFTDGTLSLVPEPISRKNLIRSFTTGTCKEGKMPRSPLSKPLKSHSSRLSNEEIVDFLKRLVSEQTGISIEKIYVSENLVSYGIDSIGVVRAAQKLSDFLGVQIGAVDIFTATCIEELACFSEDQLKKSQPQSDKNISEFHQEPEIDEITDFLITEVSPIWQAGISLLQILALMYVCTMLTIPTYISVSVFTKLSYISISLQLDYLIPLFSAPLVWIFAIFLTSISISILGNSFLRLNYALTPEISIWTIDFVRWWALYKASEFSSKIMAVHLRGTVYLKYWFQILGARIGSSVTIDTVDITDPSLVSIGDGAVIAEGALIQSHEVKNGVISFAPIRIGRNSLIGPYSVLQKGSILGEDAEVPALQKTEGGKSVSRSTNHNPFQKQKGIKDSETTKAIHQFVGIYMIGFLSSLSAAIIYFLYIQLSQNPPSSKNFSFLCLSGAFHSFPFILIIYAIMFENTYLNPQSFAITIALAYFSHGLVLTLLTAITNHFLKTKIKSPIKTWLRHRLTVACHLRFAKLLSGTEAFCIYLRLLGAKIGKHCSIRAINPVIEPELLSLGDGVHLGDFSKIITGFYSSSRFKSGKIEVRENSVLGSQSLLLPGSVIQENVIIGAVSVCPMNNILQRGGIYIGSEKPIMIKNTMHALEERIEEMDTKYKKIIGNLAANLAATTLKVKTRYFHRIGVSGKGNLNIYDTIKGFPEHKLLFPGKNYPVIIRHSNSLSADDDARIDARGAALRIESPGGGSPLLDLTLKTGKAFYARTISDFATWLVCGLPAREEHVKRAPHIRDAVWNSLRNGDSYTEMHYYSNICRLFRFSNGDEMFVKFKLSPADNKIDENNGKIEPTGILPPETGAIPRAENDNRPLLFLAKDFQRRVDSPGGVRYIFQIQFRPVPVDEATKEIVLDCTKPWDEREYPFVDVGEIVINENLTSKNSEELKFNPFLRSHEVDVIRATSASQSASIDHGRSLIYEICQHLRNGDPLPDSWRMFLEQSDVKVDLSGCPMASALIKKDNQKIILSRTWYQALWAVLPQPILQTIVPYYFLGLIVFSTLKWVIYLKENLKNEYPVYAMLPFNWVFSGISAGLACVFAKWVLVGKRKEGEKVQIWSKEAFLDTIWQAFRTVVGDYFMNMAGGSFLFVIWMNLMGSDVNLNTYVDSMEALLNPEMVEIESGGSVGRESLLFGHIYDGEGGLVKFGKINVGEGGFVGSRAVAMPGVRVESGGRLGPLSLAMKEEIVKAK